MNKKEICSIIDKIQPLLEKHAANWVVGGSASLVLHGFIDEANDIDIIQHTKNKIVLHRHSEKRMWSQFYPDIKVDLHFSSIDYIDEYQKCFHKIIHALYYIDNIHSVKYSNYKISTPVGGGLINWVHHFLPYGYNDERTLIPSGKDEIALKSILGIKAYKIIKWNVEISQIENKQTSSEFMNFSTDWKSGENNAADKGCIAPK